MRLRVRYGASEGPRAFVSTVKMRQAGSQQGTIDTEVSSVNALQSLIDHKLRLSHDVVPDVLPEYVSRMI